MDDNLPLDEAIWKFLRDQGIKLPESTGTLTIGGVEVPVEVPEDLVG
jgi:hypothetical protein